MNEFEEIKDFGTKKTGMKVPNHYFDDFTARMDSLIDQEENSTQNEINDEEKVKKISFKSTIVKVKPFLYLAAMYIALFICFKFFIKETDHSQVIVQNEQLVEEQYIIEDAMYASINDYDIIEYLYANAE